MPGSVIVQLAPEAAASVTASIPTAPVGAAATSAETFGIGDLDKALGRLGLRSIARVHPPVVADAYWAGSAAADAGAALASTYRLRFDPDQSPEDVVGAVGALDAVTYAEPDRYRETYVVPNDPDFPRQWGLSKINAPTAWNRTTGSPAVVVAIVDTGVDLNHPELAPLLLPGTDMVDLGPNPTPPAGFRFEGDFAGRDPIPDDEVGHGTHVAGTVAATSNDGVGVAGVTWQCRLLPVKVLTRIVRIADGQVRGVGSSADIAAGIRWAADNGAQVINLSLGSSSATQVERDAVAYAVARGVVVVAAMGNGGPAAPASFPAAYPDVVAVGAIDVADALASFSQVGAHIDVVAPGVDVWSTYWNDTYRSLDGTSMATPHVSGVAALIRSANPALTAAQAADIIRQTARPLRDAPTDPVPNDRYGYGIVDAGAAVARAAPPIRTITVACRSIVRCPPESRLVRCPPSRTVACPPSLLVRCPPSRLVRCPESIATPCAPSVLRCPPSVVVRCPPSAIVRCPDSLVRCTPDTIIRPEPGPLGQAMYDPFAAPYDPYGYGGWDPYAPYGEDPYGPESDVGWEDPEGGGPYGPGY